MEKRTRFIIGIFLIIIIVGMLLLITLNYSKWFVSKVDLSYPDGCIEKYENGKLITPNCTIGRMMIEQNRKQNNNFSIQPFTFT